MRDVSRGHDSGRVAVGMEQHDVLHWNILWICEKWGQDAVDWAVKKLQAQGFTHFHDRINGRLVLRPFADGISSTLLRTLYVEPDLVDEVSGNGLLNEGIQEIWDLVIAAGGTTAYNNANAEIGVGDSTTAFAATHTDLQAATNKLFKGMVTAYPARTNQTVDWRSDFTSAEANYAWQEWSIRNGNTRNKNLNRKVESLGTKSTGTWTLTGSVTLS